MTVHMAYNTGVAALYLNVSTVVAQFVLVVPLTSLFHDVGNQLETERISPIAMEYPSRLKHGKKVVQGNSNVVQQYGWFECRYSKLCGLIHFR